MADAGANLVSERLDFLLQSGYNIAVILGNADNVAVILDYCLS